MLTLWVIFTPSGRSDIVSWIPILPLDSRVPLFGVLYWAVFCGCLGVSSIFQGFCQVALRSSKVFLICNYGVIVGGFQMGGPGSHLTRCARVYL